MVRKNNKTVKLHYIFPNKFTHWQINNSINFFSYSSLILIIITRLMKLYDSSITYSNFCVISKTKSCIFILSSMQVQPKSVGLKPRGALSRGLNTIFKILLYIKNPFSEIKNWISPQNKMFGRNKKIILRKLK